MKFGRGLLMRTPLFLIRKTKRQEAETGFLPGK